MMDDKEAISSSWRGVCLQNPSDFRNSTREPRRGRGGVDDHGSALGPAARTGTRQQRQQGQPCNPSLLFVLVIVLTMLSSCSILVAGAAHADASSSETTTNGSSPSPQPSQCTIYMAPSTIPGAGLGIFTGVDRKTDESIGQGDVMIPIVDLWYHMEFEDSGQDPTADYIWHGPEMGMQDECYDPENHVSAFAPGLDAAINCNLALINVDKTVPVYDDSGYHRALDPGAGAITPYHNCSTVASHDIPAGGELFKFYGDHWFLTRPETLGEVPVTKDYVVAESLTKKFQQYFIDEELLSASVAQEFWDVITNFDVFDARGKNAFPPYSSIEFVAEESIRAHHEPSGIRSLEELDRVGRCVDRIVPGKSTIPQAGKGVFAKEFLPEGTVVASTPLLFTPNDEIFKLYDGNWFSKDREVIDRSKVIGHQILLNYCWHHPDSTVYLCPYGVMVNYINHADRHDSTRSPNVRLQWAADGEMGHKSRLLETSPNDISSHDNYNPAPGLFVDFIALRDIEPGEEILMDYGSEWQAAWDAHVQRWNERTRYSQDFQSAREWNKRNADAVLQTEEEQDTSGRWFPSHMEMRCLKDIDRTNDLDDIAAAMWTVDISGIPCQIKDRQEHYIDDADEPVYYYRVWYRFPTVNVYENEDELDDWYESDWIPRGAISFIDRPYSSNLFLEEAFRHPIGIPDDLFPDEWRNKRKRKVQRVKYEPSDTT